MLKNRNRQNGNEISFMLTVMGNGTFTLEIVSTIADSSSESPSQSEVWMYHKAFHLLIYMLKSVGVNMTWRGKLGSFKVAGYYEWKIALGLVYT